MPMFHNLLRMMGQSSGIDADLSEVYSYANTFGITRQQVNAKIVEKPFLRSRLIGWKYLIHSLFDTGYTPWIKGDGVAYFIVPIKPNVDSYAEIVIKGDIPNTRLLLGCRYGSSNDAIYVKTRHLISINNNCIRYDWVNNDFYNSYSVPLPQKTKIKVAKGLLAINDVTIVNNPNVDKTTPDVNFAIFTCNNANGATTSYQYDGYFNRVVITGDIAPNVNGSVNLVPYLNNGEYGMLDLVSGNFYGSAVANGRFSYELWDENNNAVNIV